MLVGMRAMVLEAVGGPLVLRERPRPVPGAGEVRVRVEACAVCRTDVHVIDGDLPDARLPIVLGHEIVGVVDAVGPEVSRFAAGDRIGVPWLGWTCGVCDDCRGGRENLCDRARFTGHDRDGGFAEYTIADARFCLRLPPGPAAPLAPLLCAGLIGYRALKMTGDARRIGCYGFGAAAHILAQVVVAQRREIYAFTRPGDEAAQAFARELGARWAGDSTRQAPTPLDAAIIFAPVGDLVPKALRDVRRGGMVVCAGIHMTDIPSFPYAWLWGERIVRSVANLTVRDGEEFLALAPTVPVRTTVERYPLEHANEALARLRAGTTKGAAVLEP